MALKTGATSATRAISPTGGAGAGAAPPRRPARTSSLPDELVDDLVAAGSQDVLVGLVTLNHAATIAPVVTSVLHSFSGRLMRQRTLLLNLDGGSTDDTPAIVRGIQEEDQGRGGPVHQAIQHPLRTVHRLSHPYHGVVGRPAALRTLLAVADLLGARALVVIDPEHAALAPDEVSALALATMSGDSDFVKCAPLRSPWEGPLLSQLLRPLTRACLGRVLQEPLDVQFACGARFLDTARRALEADATSAEGFDPDLHLCLAALAGAYEVAELQVAREPVAASRAPPLARLFPSVVGGMLDALARPADTPGASAASGRRPVRVLGTRESAPPSARRPTIDVGASERAFVEGLSALRPLLEPLVPAPDWAALESGAAADPPVLGPVAWARAVAAFVRSAREKRMRGEQLAQALLPLYEGRVATFLRETARRSAEEVRRGLLEFEEVFEGEVRRALTPTPPASTPDDERADPRGVP